jgi:hypothetical protein
MSLIKTRLLNPSFRITYSAGQPKIAIHQIHVIVTLKTALLYELNKLECDV